MLIPWRVYNSTYCILCVLVVIVFFLGGFCGIVWRLGAKRWLPKCHGFRCFFSDPPKRWRIFGDFCEEQVSDDDEM